MITTATHAQIVLHEATDITQTKATLSADFPDLSVEHESNNMYAAPPDIEVAPIAVQGFQYKYGALPEIDDFSKLALSSLSDPVQINTSGNAWSARTVKGWVESKSNLGVGQSSVMSATVNFSKPTNVTFEWSVDSEEGIGLLSFIVDGNIVSEISGAVDFTKVSYQATAGEHTLQWQYKKTAATNVGLDLGMVRNIDLQNTTEGEWITESTSSSQLQLNNLFPGKSYLFRAYQSDTYSVMSVFKTKCVTINFFDVNDITQTSATINCDITEGDAVLNKKIVVGEDIPDWRNSEIEKILFRENSLPVNITSSKSYWKVDYDDNGEKVLANKVTSSGLGYVYPSFEISVNLEESTQISFDWKLTNNGGQNYLYFIVDGKTVAYRQSMLDYETFTYVLSEGTHTIKWEKHLYSNSYSYLKNVKVGERTIFETTQKDISFERNKTKIFELLPNTKYKCRVCLGINGNNKLQNTKDSIYSDWKYFTTLPVFADILSVIDIKQASATIRGKVDGGDATIIATGLQYKNATGARWTEYPKDGKETELSQNISRLKPNTTYHYRSYIQAQDCDTVFSEIGEFTTLAVEPQKPTIVRLSQHEAELQGKVRFGDASIYQRGMQFRKSGETEWEEVEDGGNDSIYTLVKKNLEMGITYEARTYIQPAGCDILFSDILQFTTRQYYFTGSLESQRKQTTVQFSATLADVDEGVTVEEYGFEYYLDSDGFFENAESFIKSDVIRIPVTPENGEITTTVTGLTPQYGLRFRAYIKINGEYIYYTSYKDWTWDHAGTDRATIKASVKELTQTSVTLELDATQDGDAVVTQVEYAFANSVQDTKDYQVCGNELTINNLTPNTKYNLRFRGTVNGRLCPLLQDIGWDYSWFEFTTKAVTIAATFNDITQTKATMKVYVNAGDAEVTDLQYSLNNGTYTACDKTVVLEGLKPGTLYKVTFSGKINGKYFFWTRPSSLLDEYNFTTKSVSANAYSTAIEQTSAIIHCSYSCGDATYLSSGIEYGTTTAMTESKRSDESEIRLTELTPNTTYYWQAYIETEEGGKTYTYRNTFKTTAISCTTLPISNISNRSATMNGTIDCDSYSSAEFGFQWKQMEGWNSDPAFTKGVKNEDGSISVALVNGMLEPNTDYQYRAAVRYKGNIYYASKWETFRTEAEFVYYPACVYTIFRTDRENNCLVLCGYYVAGSEDIVAQGYEYWNNSASASSYRASVKTNNIIQLNTDESMQYSLDLKTLADGYYSVRAFVKTSSGATIYGETLAFGIENGTISGVDNIETERVGYSISNGILSIYNAKNMSCTIYNIHGQIVECRQCMTDNEQFYLASGIVYIVRLSNGAIFKIRI